MLDIPADLKEVVSTWRQQREPTKLECGLLGALSATILMAFLLWLSVQLSIINLVIQFK
jgi:hypothetical protein